MPKARINLREALALGKLDRFAQQEEAPGVAPADMGTFDSLLRQSVKPPKSKRQTSRSASRGNSGGSKTR